MNAQDQLAPSTQEYKSDATRVIAVTRDVGENRKPVEAKTNETPAFETLLANLSAHFVDISLDRLNQEIADAQKRVCEHFGIDSASLWQQSTEDPMVFRLVAMHRPESMPAIPKWAHARELFPWSFDQALKGNMVIVPDVTALPTAAARDLETSRYYGIRSTVIFPLPSDGRPVFGIAAFGSRQAARDWPDSMVQRLAIIAQIFASALARQRVEQLLRDREARLQAESEYLKEERNLTLSNSIVIGESAAMKEVLHLVEQVASMPSTVLLIGETGTGKELIAELIHHLSPRKNHVIVKVNCAALPAALVESELFGREKGAYTGALMRQAGRFEIADQSTIFLDEIGELPLEVQGKLLRVLQEGQFERLGNPKALKVDVRVIAATNRDLAAEVRKGRFREDLFYRLNVFPIRIPPLRERPEDVPLLIWRFIEEFCSRMGKNITKVPHKSMEILQRHSWPGNVRELRNIMEHSVIISPGETLRIPSLEDSAEPSEKLMTLVETERECIVKTLEITRWRIKGPKGAAERLGIKPSTLYSRMEKLGIPTRRERDRVDRVPT